MRLRQIEVFQAIIQAGTISGAARLLNVSQPNVSRVLNHTEQQLGFSLFDRSSKGLIVTQEGKRLLPEIERLTYHLHSINELTDTIRTEKAHTIRIGAAHACSQMVVVPTMVEYRQAQPKEHVDLVTEHFATLQEAVQNEQLDFALVFGQHTDSSLLAEPLFQSDMVAIVPKHMSVPDEINLSWLCQHNFLMMQENDPLGRVLHRALQTHHLQPSNPLLIKTYSVIADMVVSGGGVGVVDLFTASRYANDVQILPLKERLPFELVFITRRNIPQSKQIIELKQRFRAQCRKISKLNQHVTLKKEALLHS
ncbi:LysR family transcriptional regulator [Vibrio nitrifigilis]|uniref:LysR family transcriptional regulator n=1 Tax=Vibrio nitrifigilis TaxID=2789781 RepID=A0ABS0GHZ9_9VIBR|nr:LysR family transcriptional regulator [Vibrio nitrifigilis]MBF9002068.1 LysR family transcriptional regulator [Vibrio nitrifigilis]